MAGTNIGTPISPILPPGIRTGRSGNYRVIDTSAVAVAVVGTANQVVLNTREVRLGVFGRETVEEYQVHAGGTAAARDFMNDCLRDERCSDARRKGGNGETILVEVVWAYDREDSTWVQGADKPLWGFEIVDTSQPLMSHPYFGRRYISGGGTLMAEMGTFDQKFAMGETYKVAAGASAEVQAVMSRYAGLRMSGVEEWNPTIIMLYCNLRLFPSMIGGDDPPFNYEAVTWGSLLKGINRTVATPPAPAHILAAINNLEILVFPSSGATFPSTTPADAGAENAKLRWILQKPQIRQTGKNLNGPSDVTFSWIGLQQAAAVLYPGYTQELNTGLWDPTQVVT
jgi:hypothetical protein